MRVKDLKINFRYLGENIACLSVDSIDGKSVHNDVNNEEAIIIFNSLIGEKENCKTIKSLLKENQELKKHLKVPENCNLKTLEDYKSYYEDTTREQILEDSYIDYCAYVNLAHRYSKLKKQLEEYQKDIKDLDNQNKRAVENMQLNQLKVCNMIKQQKEFIKWLKDKIHTIETTYSQINGNYGLMNEKLEALKEVLQKYKKIMNGDDK